LVVEARYPRVAESVVADGGFAPAPNPFLPKRLLPQRSTIERMEILRSPSGHAGVSLDEFLDAATPIVVGQGDTPDTFTRAPVRDFAVVFRRLVQKRSLRLDDLLDCHAAIAPEAASCLRRGDVHCGGVSRESAVYLPPPAITLSGYLKDLLLFINNDGRRMAEWFVPSLVAAAQLVLVHPFAEGNGRTARALFAIIACRHSGFDRGIVVAMQRLWSHESLLIEAVCSRVISNGWQQKTLVGLN